MKCFNKVMAIVLSVCIMASIGAINFGVFAATAASITGFGRIEANEVQVIENSSGWYYDGHYIYDPKPDFTVFLADGSECPTTVDGSFMIDGQRYTVHTDNATQNSENGYWTVGNTYKTTAELFVSKTIDGMTYEEGTGIVFDFNVTIIETPVESLSVGDIEVIENTCGRKEADGRYIYDSFSPSYTVKMKNGDEYSVAEGERGAYIDGKWTGLSCSSPDWLEGVSWSVGNTYKVKAELDGFGFSTEFNVTIVESPVESLTVYDTEVTEKVGGYYNDDNFVYSDFHPSFKVKMKDGSEYISNEQGDDIELPGGKKLYLEFSSLQNNVDGYWSPGNTYEVKAELYSGSLLGAPKQLGATDTFNVTVKQGPFKSLEISDIEIMVNTCGYFDGSGQYIYTGFTPGFVLEMRDGRKYTVEPGNNGITVDGVWHSLSFMDVENGGRWTVGNTYSVTAGLTETGLEDTFNVTVVGSPVESLEIEDISLIEETNGYYDFTGNFVYTLSPTVKLKLKDGREYVGQNGVTIDGVWYGLSYNTAQNETSGYWTAGNTYTASVSMLGYTAEFKVTISESPVESLTVKDVEMIEGTDPSNLAPVFTFKLKDGREYTGQFNWVDVDGESYRLYVDYGYSVNPDEWTAGNTYTVTGSILGFTSEFRVTVKATPIAKIEVPDVSVIENTNGYYRDGQYVYMIDPSFTITMKDGRVIPTNAGSATIDDVYYNLNIDTDASGAWTVGNTYRVKASVTGVECYFNITVIEDPIKSISVDGDKTLYEHSGYIDDSGRLRYTVNEFLPFSVTLKDGTVIESESYRYPARVNSMGGMGGADPVVYIGGLSYGIDGYRDDQDENTWGVGKHTATVSLLSHECSFTVTIKESSIKSVETEDMVYIKGVDSIYNSAPKYTVTFKDGSKKSYDGSRNEYVEADGDSVSLRLFGVEEDKLVPGNTYRVQGALGHVKCEFNVKVITCPITGIELIKQPDKTEYLTEEYFDSKGAVVRIKYDDNTYEDISLTESSALFCSAEYYCKKLGRYFSLYGDYLFSAGNTNQSINIFGKSVSCAITVRDNGWTSIIAESNGKDELVLKTVNENGDESSLRMLAVYVQGESAIENGKAVTAGIVTDAGNFKAVIYSYNDGTYSVEIGDKMADVGKSEWLTGALEKNDASGKLGDINGDKKIDATDALLALQASVGKYKLGAEKQQLADVDNSGSVTATDALLILQMAVGKIDRF